MVKSQNSKFSEAFAKFNNSSTSCDVARLSSHTPTKSKTKLAFHGDEAMKASISTKMVFHDDRTLTNSSSHTLSSSSHHESTVVSQGARKHEDSFFVENPEDEMTEKVVKCQKSKFSEAFAKFNNSSTSCDVARLSIHTPSHSKARFSFHGDEAMKQSIAKKMVFHDDDNLTNASSHTNLSSTSYHNESFRDCHPKSQHADTFFMEHLEGDKEDEYVRGMNYTIEDKFNDSGRPNDYVGGYSPEWIRRYRRQKGM